MTVIVTGQPSRPRKGRKKIAATRVPKGPEVEYRNSLLALNRLLKAQTALISAAVTDGATPLQVRQMLDQMIAEANERFDVAAAQIAPSNINRLSRANKERVERSLRNAIGVDAAQILDSDAVRDQIELAVAENVGLIKSIPEQHHAKVAQAVFNNFRGEKFEEGSLANRLKALGAQTDRRAKFIARDQTAKFTASVNEIRQNDAGIVGYIWRNSQDRRVVGNPAGPYKPTRAHGNHWEREGKFFRWDDPPGDGHPGQAIGCRCFPEPVVDFNQLQQQMIVV